MSSVTPFVHVSLVLKTMKYFEGLFGVLWYFNLTVSVLKNLIILFANRSMLSRLYPSYAQSENVTKRSDRRE